MKVQVWIYLLLETNAWNADGHKSVAKVASELLSRKTARFVTNHIPRERTTGRMTRITNVMVTSSTWADHVVGDPRFASTDEEHFGHTPYRNCQPFKINRDCGFERSGRCIVTAIGKYAQQASRFDITKEQRTEALKFIIHLMADIHNPLHLGFAQDFGGNRIHVFPDGGSETSLHELWDSSLYSDDSFFAIANSILNSNNDHYRIKTEFVTVDKAERLATVIATETIMRHTCSSAYRITESDWIENGHQLREDDYLATRRVIVKEQLAKSAVRLAQLLEAIAEKYYQEQFIATNPVTERSRSSSDSSNPFSILDMTFDVEENVYEVEDAFDELSSDEDEQGKADPPHIDASGTEHVTASSTDQPPTAEEDFAVEERERQRRRNQRAKERRKLSRKRESREFDVTSLVLIKRRALFYITSKDRVVSDEFIPMSVRLLSVQFAGEERRRQFFLDVDVITMPTITMELVMTVFRHLGGWT